MLEITESAVVADPRRTEAVLERLSEMSVRLSVDDFGTGYSSLTYLTRLPIDEIKIDRSFVTNMSSSPGNEVIVRSTIDLARNLGHQVVAEGVETAEVLKRLEALGCHLAQGYYVSRPLPIDELDAWLVASDKRPDGVGVFKPWSGCRPAVHRSRRSARSRNSKLSLSR